MGEENEPTADAIARIRNHFGRVDYCGVAVVEATLPGARITQHIACNGADLPYFDADAMLPLGEWLVERGREHEARKRGQLEARKGGVR